MRTLAIVLFVLFSGASSYGDEYLGRLSRNPYVPDSTAGVGGSNYRIRQSMENQYGTGGPRLYDDSGNFRGNLNGNRYDPDSISNPYGRYGSEYSPDSINNPYGAGSRYKPDSPTNPYGTGLIIIDD